MFGTLTVDVQRDVSLEFLSLGHRSVPHDASIHSAVIVPLRGQGEHRGGGRGSRVSRLGHGLQRVGQTILIPPTEHGPCYRSVRTPDAHTVLT